MPVFRRGDLVILNSQKGKKWMVRVGDGVFSCHFGAIDLSDAIGLDEGDCLETNLGGKICLLRPTLEDYIFKMRRRTQIIYPKDLGAILFYGDINPGDTVLESGMGSGAMTLALLRAAGDRGTVISIEKRWEFASGARQNIEGLYGEAPENHKIVVADIQDVHLNVQADRMIVDLPEPWHAVRNISGMLRNGAILVSLSPNVGQVQLTYRELKANGFMNLQTFELLKRDWMVDEVRARPVDRMISHTGFITVAKKTSALPVGDVDSTDL
jgi:tRNA (adenine57-N1/adenine58-N1)-methyltransferase